MKNVYKNYDVVVVGGGIAGIAGALSAARNNAKVLLVEATYMLGGLATGGLVTFYLPLCDGEGHQVSYGIAEELLRLSISKGYENEGCDEWLNNGSMKEKIDHRFRCQYNPYVFAILAEKLLINNKVDILYGTTLSDVKVENDFVKEVTLTSRTQKIIVTAKGFVDSTGDATLFDLAGEETKVCEKGNILACWYYTVTGGEYKLRAIGSSDMVYSNYDDSVPSFTGIEAYEVSDQTINGHQTILKDFLKDGEDNSKHALATIGNIPEIRMSRRLVGQASPYRKEEKVYVEDSIGCYSSWLEAGPSFELSYKTLLGNRIKNVAAAGRCISVGDTGMWDMTRVIPVCAVTGEAAGLIASEYTDFTQIDIKHIQNKLRERKIPLHLDECGIKYKN